MDLSKSIVTGSTKNIAYARSFLDVPVHGLIVDFIYHRIFMVIYLY